ncbi:Hydroxypyruvate reductase [subsurface metagenome]
MSRWKVLCNVDLKLKPDVLKVVEEIANVDYVEARQGILLQCIEKYDAYYASASVRANAEVLERAHRLKVIATPSTGTDHIDIDIARQKDIDILDLAKEYDLLNTFSATVEMTWCLLLACLRRLPGVLEDAKRGNWSREKFTGNQLLDKTLGVLGCGRLGRMMAEIGKGFRMKVIACDVLKFEYPGVEQVDFDTLLTRSDVLQFIFI